MATAQYRDRQILKAIGTLLTATGAFDEVRTSGLPADRGLPSSDGKLVVLDLDQWQDRDRSDDPDATPQDRDVTFLCYVCVRMEDPDMRDDELDRLVQTATNAINGQSVLGVTLPEWTRLLAGKWMPPTAPERRVICRGSFRYLLDDFDSHNDAADTGA